MNIDSNTARISATFIPHRETVARRPTTSILIAMRLYQTWIMVKLAFDKMLRDLNVQSASILLEASDVDSIIKHELEDGMS